MHGPCMLTIAGVVQLGPGEALGACVGAAEGVLRNLVMPAVQRKCWHQLNERVPPVVLAKELLQQQLPQQPCRD